MGRFTSTTFTASTLLMLLLVVVFAKLGYWQLSRAQEKIDMLSARDVAATQPPLDRLDNPFNQDDLYREVRLSGRFDYTNQFLLDNRIYKGQPGYEVLTPFHLSGGDDRPVIMVNRGWVAGSADRNIKPPLEVPERLAEADLVLAGLITTPSKGFSLGEVLDSGQFNWPIVIQYIDYETIASKLDRMEIIEAVIVSAPDQAGNYTYNWQPVAHGPEKHFGYAFQWFAMLLAVLVFYVYLNFIKKHE